MFTISFTEKNVPRIPYAHPTPIRDTNQAATAAVALRLLLLLLRRRRPVVLTPSSSSAPSISPSSSIPRGADETQCRCRRRPSSSSSSSSSPASSNTNLTASNGGSINDVMDPVTAPANAMRARRCGTIIAAAYVDSTSVILMGRESPSTAPLASALPPPLRSRVDDDEPLSPMTRLARRRRRRASNWPISPTAGNSWRGYVKMRERLATRLIA
mmetsp:Transcript_8498/g.25672  ORF Transcript_8498/g.25672 Transcript_8498/m.25672 type:complete len:214 (+) Transcript_8498:423-1064(+)